MIRNFVAAVLLLYFIDPAVAQDSRIVCFSDSSPGAVIPACDDLIETDPRHAQAYQARGIAWYKVGDYERALLTTAPPWRSIQNIPGPITIEVLLGRQKATCRTRSKTFTPSKILIRHFRTQKRR